MSAAGAEPTGPVIRGIAYATAAGSLAALSRSNGLVADYLNVLKESPATPPAVRHELGLLAAAGR